MEVTVLSRDPARARETLGVEAVGWDPLAEPAPVAALAGRDAVVHLAGENIAQRWSARAKRAIRESRVLGTRNLVAGLRAAGEEPGESAGGDGGGVAGPANRPVAMAVAVAVAGPANRTAARATGPTGRTAAASM